MEYLVVTLVIVLPLLGLTFDVACPVPNAGTGVFRIDDMVLAGQVEGAPGNFDDFGVVGSQMVYWYRRLMAGIALPIP
jgi:hypothetical protein